VGHWENFLIFFLSQTVLDVAFSENKNKLYVLMGYILFITKFIGSSPNFNDASPNIEI